MSTTTLPREKAVHRPLPMPVANFDRLARAYRWMEWLSFGPWLGWCRRAFLPELRERRRGLVLGDGDGRFTARLLKTNPEIRVDAVDASPAMLSVLMQNAGTSSTRVRTFCADAREWRPLLEPRYDIIATHFFLDCLATDEIRTLALCLREAAAPNVIWVISEFAIPGNRFGRFFARPLVGALYYAFGLLTGLKLRRLPDWTTSLRDAGFVPIKRRLSLHGLLVTGLWRQRQDLSLRP